MAFFAEFSEQIHVFLLSLILGLCLGLLFDVFRVLRVFLTGDSACAGNVVSNCFDRAAEKLRGTAARHGKLKRRYADVVVFLTDMLFGFVAAVILTVFLFHANYGQPRLHIYIGCVLGFAAYHTTFGRLSAALTGTAVAFLKLTVVFVYYKLICFLPRLLAARGFKAASQKTEQALAASAASGFGCFAEAQTQSSSESLSEGSQLPRKHGHGRSRKERGS